MSINIVLFIFWTENLLYLAMTLIYSYNAYLGISKFVLFRCENFPGPVLVGFLGFFFFVNDKSQIRETDRNLHELQLSCSYPDIFVQSRFHLRETCKANFFLQKILLRVCIPSHSSETQVKEFKVNLNDKMRSFIKH